MGSVFLCNVHKRKNSLGAYVLIHLLPFISEFINLATICWSCCNGQKHLFTLFNCSNRKCTHLFVTQSVQYRIVFSFKTNDGNFVVIRICNKWIKISTHEKHLSTFWVISSFVCVCQQQLLGCGFSMKIMMVEIWPVCYDFWLKLTWEQKYNNLYSGSLIKEREKVKNEKFPPNVTKKYQKNRK